MCVQGARLEQPADIGMSFRFLGLWVFAFLVGTLFAVRFHVAPTHVEYALGIVWSAMLSSSVAVIVRRMAAPHVAGRKSLR